MDTLARTVHFFSTDIGMAFGITTMKRGKVVRFEGIKPLNCEVMKEVEKEGYTYLGLDELDRIKENEMKEITKEYKGRLQLVLN